MSYADLVKTSSDRDFLSFTFDGKEIEDFGLVITSSSDKFTRPISPAFSDITSTIPGVDGKQYWGTVIDSNSFSVSLATDGMTARQLENFKKHFQAGRVGKLIFAESPYKYCYCKIGDNISPSLVPFDSVETIGSDEYPIIIYKGTMEIKFVLYDPYFYGDYSFLSEDAEDENYYKKRWALESGIPRSNSLTSNTILANNILYYSGSFISSSSQAIQLTSSGFKVYAAGSIDSKPKISFTITPEFNNNNYIVYPFNSRSTSTYPYNIINISYNGSPRGSFKFSLPNIFYSYNDAAEIIDKYDDPYGDQDSLIEEIRDGITHDIIRQQAIGYVRSTSIGSSPEDVKEDLKSIFYNGASIRSYAVVLDPSATGSSSISGILTLNNFDQSMTKYSYDFSEESSCMMRSGWMVIPAGEGIQSNGLVSGLTNLVSDHNISGFKLDFRNTYT